MIYLSIVYFIGTCVVLVILINMPIIQAIHCIACSFSVCKKRGNMLKAKCADIIQTLISISMLILALLTIIFGYNEYQTYKRPYVTLIKVNIASNLEKMYPIIHPNSKKEVYPSEIITAGQEIIEVAEEVIVDLYYKNTGPIAAKNVKFTRALLAGDSFTIDGKRNPHSIINDSTNFFELKIDGVIAQEEISLKALAPQQEEKFQFMFHRYDTERKYNVMKHDSSNTNPLYIVCKIEYDPIDSKENTKKHGYFAVYKLFHPAAYTRLYCSKQKEGEIW